MIVRRDWLKVVLGLLVSGVCVYLVVRHVDWARVLGAMRSAHLGPLVLAAVIGAFVAWLDIFGASSNAFDTPVQFLFDYQTTASDDLSVGLLVVACAVLAGVLTLVPSLRDRVGFARLIGVVLAAISVAFVIQLALAADDIGVSFGDVYGLGPFVSGAGGIAMLTGK